MATFDARRAETAHSMLDMATGGGERLSWLSRRPQLTVATEAWPPDVPVAAARRVISAMTGSPRPRPAAP